MNNGHIRGFVRENTVEFDENHNIVSLLGKGTWIDSYEAVEHVKRLGISDTPSLSYTDWLYKRLYVNDMWTNRSGKRNNLCRKRGFRM